jgi:hypothetical protein
MYGNYHEYGVNVKVYKSLYVKGQEVLSDEVLEDIYNYAVETFWLTLEHRTNEEFDGMEISCEGRSGGWAVYGSGTFEPPEKWVTMVNNLVKYFCDTFYIKVVKDEIADVVGENPTLARLYV